ncbi:hypothetical protein RhiirC2_805009 [Rhizophagus irregularis]|uniref:Uncharacterized protein n=1 Tax=Rhizophagus irregularis TaxID=588596 RepID=A0A2N1KVH1_9GLOM|nr:hypothetical protein RhiirC2_805009 [Rhizophagus irregularis]
MSVTTEGSEEILVSIILPELDECNEYVQQAVFDRYHAEIIGKDLFIKIDRGHKTRIQFELNSSADTHNPNWFITQGTDC